MKNIFIDINDDDFRAKKMAAVEIVLCGNSCFLNLFCAALLNPGFKTEGHVSFRSQQRVLLFIVGCQEYPTVAMTGLKPRLWGFLNENRVKIMTILGDYTVSVLGEDGYKVTT